MAKIIAVYSKAAPVFRGDLKESLHLEANAHYPNKVGYAAFPQGNGSDPFSIIAQTSPSIYVHAHGVYGNSVDRMVDEAKRSGVKLPDALVEKARKRDGVLKADGELASILKQHPEVAKALGSYEPLWKIVLFGGGAPVYETVLQAEDGTDKTVVGTMTRLGQFLTVKHDGAIWDRRKHRFSRPIRQDGKPLDNLRFRSFDPSLISWDRWF